MSATTLTRPATRSHASATQPVAVSTSRFDIYAPIHKALRGFMSDTLARLGRLDLDDAAECSTTFGQLEDLLAFCERHVEHEDAFIHTAIAARRPVGAGRTVDDHVEHLESIAALRGELETLRAAANPRDRLALCLYRHVALFIADNYQHMHIEETVNNAALWALYSDDELVDVHHRLLASIAPAEHLEVARWMIPALPPADRARLLGQMQREAPPAAFAAVVEVVRPHLDSAAWAKLSGSIALAQPAAVGGVCAFG